MCLADCSIINSIWVVKMKMTGIRLFSIYYFISWYIITQI